MNKPENAKQPDLHILKTDPNLFEASWLGNRSLETRFNDRGFTAAHPNAEISEADTGGDLGELNASSTCAKKHKPTPFVLKREPSART